MEIISNEVRDLQARCDRFIVLKDFKKLGSLVMGFNQDTDLQYRSTLAKCDMAARGDVQVVALGGPNCLEVYAEYAPYTILTSELEAVKICMSGNCPGIDHPFLKARLAMEANEERDSTQDN